MTQKLTTIGHRTAMSKARAAQSAIKDPEITMYNNSNGKTNGLIYIQKMNEKQICNT